MRIALVSSEVAPFAKTGGLADVAAALARHLGRVGHDVRLFMPMHRRVRESGLALEPVASLQDIPMTLGERRASFSISTAPLPDSEVKVYFVRAPEFFDRESIYTSDDDEALRFHFFSRAALESCQYDQWAPDIVHANDWHTALCPLLLNLRYSWDKLFAGTKTVLTIHNIGYQGVFPTSVLPDLDLEEHRQYLYREDLADGVFSFLKTGILYADRLTTVSETYAQEIQGEELGMGLEGLLQARADSLVGIVNGIDTDIWNPATDPDLPENYDAENLAPKARNKTRLLEEMGLAPAPDSPLFGVVSRLTGQKGFELFPDILPVLLREVDLRLVILGSGEEKYEDYFAWLERTFPGKVAFRAGYDDALAHRIEGSCDLFLMPSRYEPCGLNQMYSLRYGTVPIVRKTGGLADTVTPFDPATGEGTGFVFEEFEPEALFGAMRQALELWGDRASWDRLVQNGMKKDYSWERQGAVYEALYRSLLA